MTEHERPVTGPVTLPSNPKAVADHKVSALSTLGNLHKPPTEREYEHAALDIALAGGTEEEVFAVLAHLETDALHRLVTGTFWLRSALDAALADRLTPEG